MNTLLFITLGFICVVLIFICINKILYEYVVFKIEKSLVKEIKRTTSRVVDDFAKDLKEGLYGIIDLIHNTPIDDTTIKNETLGDIISSITKE